MYTFKKCAGSVKIYKDDKLIAEILVKNTDVLMKVLRTNAGRIILDKLLEGNE